MRTVKILFIVLGLLLCVAFNAFAVNFDVIVPSVIEVGSRTIYGHGYGNWASLIATTDTISQADFQNAIFTTQIDNPLITVSGQGFMNIDYFAPLSPGEIANGMDTDYIPSPVLSLLNEGETFVDLPIPVSFWSINFDFPYSYSGTGILTTSLQLGDQTLNFTSEVIFDNSFWSGSNLIEAQRLSTTVVPEPISSILFITGSATLGLRRFIRKKLA